MKNRKLFVSILAGVMAALMLLGLFVGVLPTRANAQSSSEIREQINELKAEKKEYEAQIAELQSQLSDNMTKMEETVAKKNIIDQEIFLLHEQVANINEQISAYSLLIADKQDELDAAQARLNELNEKNKERIRAMEEEGSLSYWSVLFKANNFADLLDRLNMIQEIAAADQRRLKEMSDAAEAVAVAQAELEGEKAELEDSKAELAAAEEELSDKRAEADELLLELKAQGDEYEAMIADGEQQVEDLIADIAQQEKAYTEAKRQEYLQWLSTSQPATTKPSSNNSGGGSSGGSSGSSGGSQGSAPSGGSWIRPCSYVYVSSPYGWRIHPVYHTEKFHSGIDLAARAGTPIYAARSGVVTAATYNSSSGYYVTINHRDGFSTSYLHMTNFIVSVGQEVSQGQVIGYVGSTGVSTGAHLHFTMYYNGNTVNPANYINF